MHIFGLGTPELVLIAFLLLLFFGKDKLPDSPVASANQSANSARD